MGGKTRRITLATRTFAKAGEAKAFFTTMLNRYAVGDRVSPDDAADLSALLSRHEDFGEKAGTGVTGFEVNVPPADAPPFSKRCFWVLRRDGTRIDFSIGHCLEPRPGD